MSYNENNKNDNKVSAKLFSNTILWNSANTGLSEKLAVILQPPTWLGSQSRAINCHASQNTTYKTRYVPFSKPNWISNNPGLHTEQHVCSYRNQGVLGNYGSIHFDRCCYIPYRYPAVSNIAGSDPWRSTARKRVVKPVGSINLFALSDSRNRTRKMSSQGITVSLRRWWSTPITFRLSLKLQKPAAPTTNRLATTKVPLDYNFTVLHH